MFQSFRKPSPISEPLTDVKEPERGPLAHAFQSYVQLIAACSSNYYNYTIYLPQISSMLLRGYREQIRLKDLGWI